MRVAATYIQPDAIRGISVPVMQPNKDGTQVEAPAGTSVALIQSGRALSVEMLDDSLAPRIVAGDEVLIDTAVGARLKDGALYVLQFGESYAVRQIHYKHNGELRLTCSNPNHKHKEQVIPKRDVQSLRVLGECKFFMGSFI